MRSARPAQLKAVPERASSMQSTCGTMARPLRKLHSRVACASTAAAAAASSCSVLLPPPSGAGPSATPAEAAKSAALVSATPCRRSKLLARGVPGRSCCCGGGCAAAAAAAPLPAAPDAAAAAAACSAIMLGDSGRCAVPGSPGDSAPSGLLAGEGGSCSGEGAAAASRCCAPARAPPTAGDTSGVAGGAASAASEPSSAAVSLQPLLLLPAAPSTGASVNASSSSVACSMAPWRASCGACSSHSTARDSVDTIASGQLSACRCRAGVGGGWGSRGGGIEEEGRDAQWPACLACQQALYSCHRLPRPSTLPHPPAAGRAVKRRALGAAGDAF